MTSRNSLQSSVEKKLSQAVKKGGAKRARRIFADFAPASRIAANRENLRRALRRTLFQAHCEVAERPDFNWRMRAPQQNNRA